MTLTLSAMDRGIRERDVRLPLANVSLVAALCRRCRMDVLVVRVGDDRLPVQLEISEVTVVADTGRVTVGHPLHDPTSCEVRVAANFDETQRRERAIAERLQQ